MKWTGGGGGGGCEGMELDWRREKCAEGVGRVGEERGER